MKGDPGAKGVQGLKGQKGTQVGIANVSFSDVQCSRIDINYGLLN